MGCILFSNNFLSNILFEYSWLVMVKIRINIKEMFYKEIKEKLFIIIYFKCI